MDRFINIERNIANNSELFLNPIRHYKRFEEKPFLKNEKNATTILLGGFTFRHDYFVRAGIEGLGYKVQNLPTPNLEVYHVGREYCNNGMCNPTYFTVGNLINYLKKLEAQGMSRDHIIKNYIYFTAGACGPCRFGMYEGEYRLALRNSGFEGFRVLTFQQMEGFNQAGTDNGLDMNEEFFLGILIGIILADIVNEIGYKIRPYEINNGETDRILKEATEEIFHTIKKKQSLLKESKIIKAFQTITRSESKGLFALILDEVLSSIYTDQLKTLSEKLSKIEVDCLRQVPIVKITGEFWAQTTEGDGNFKMYKYLEDEGAEIITEPISTWLLYLLYDGNQYITDRYESNKTIKQKINYLKKKILIKLGEYLLSREYNRFRKAVNFLPQSLTNQYLLEKLAHKYYHSRARGGEGHLEVAKSIYHTINHLSHMVMSLKPFGCLPSTQSDGVHSVVTSHYPEMNFLPIETSAEGEINAYSRVQMALTDARMKSKKEFEKSLEHTKLSVEKIREYIIKHPYLQSATYFISKRKDVVSKSANFVYHISDLIGSSK
jgi:predicted nucleotide-binding protein (sugar kinase/HSP70/actin superfamily)